MEILLILIGIIVLLILKDGGFNRPKEYIKDYPAEDMENMPIRARCRFRRKKWRRLISSRFHGRKVVVS